MNVVKEHVRVEVNIVMQENGGKLTLRSLQNLLYLDRSLKEALRLYPSVYLTYRKVAENFTEIPIFDPDRFLPEKIRNRHPYFYVPFSAGSRNWIDQRFALLELKAMIAPLVYNFYLEPVDNLKDIRLKADIIIRPSHPVHIKFIPIKCKQHLKPDTT